MKLSIVLSLFVSPLAFAGTTQSSLEIGSYQWPLYVENGEVINLQHGIGVALMKALTRGSTVTRLEPEVMPHYFGENLPHSFERFQLTSPGNPQSLLIQECPQCGSMVRVNGVAVGDSIIDEILLAHYNGATVGTRRYAITLQKEVGEEPLVVSTQLGGTHTKMMVHLFAQGFDVKDLESATVPIDLSLLKGSYVPLHPGNARMKALGLLVEDGTYSEANDEAK